jgi:DNA-binding MarR family transcriptional regulator
MPSPRTKKPVPPRGAADASAFQTRLEAAKSESTLQLLFRAARLLDEEAVRRIAARPGRRGLRRSHMSLLPHLDLAGTRITELSARLGITKQAVSQLVDDLEAMGVLAREPDPADARARRVVLTKAGRAGLFEGLAVLGHLEAELASQVGKDTMHELRRAVLSILERLPWRPALTPSRGRQHP